MALATKVFSIRSPLAITMILHARAINSPFPHWDSPAQTSIIERLVELDLIVYEGEGRMRTTERGNAWCRLICDTPLPWLSKAYVDPRNGEVIKT